MKKFLSSVTNFIHEEDGASAVEYGIMVALIAAVIITTVGTIGTKLEAVFTTVCTKLGGTGTC